MKNYDTESEESLAEYISMLAEINRLKAVLRQNEKFVMLEKCDEELARIDKELERLNKELEFLN